MYWVVLELPIWGQVLVGMSITITHGPLRRECMACRLPNVHGQAPMLSLKNFCSVEDLSSKTQFLLSIVGATSQFF